MARARAKDLPHKQAAFAAEYVHTNGNGTKAAKRAGYAESSAHVTASQLIRKPKVSQRIATLARRHEISADRVLSRLDNLSMEAEAQGQIGAAIKAEELLGKSLGMWIDRSETNINVDVSIAHLDALRRLTQKDGKGYEAARSPATVTDVSDQGTDDAD